jgi:endonuclease YncB( thermonuclease family)
MLPPPLANSRVADRRPGGAGSGRAWRVVQGGLLAVIAILFIGLWSQPSPVGHSTQSLPAPTTAPPPPITRQSSGTSASIQVIDGDTIRHQGVTVRLVGFNAPEAGRRAACETERRLGEHATRRLRELLRSGPLGFEFVACSCPPGTEGTRRCNYGRRCGVLRVNGRDVGAILVAERLAAPFRRGATSCPPLPRPWC